MTFQIGSCLSAYEHEIVLYVDIIQVFLILPARKPAKDAHCLAAAAKALDHLGNVDALAAGIHPQRRNPVYRVDHKIIYNDRLIDSRIQRDRIYHVLLRIKHLT